VGGSSLMVWWQDGVLYQVYPRSFADSDGDGVGDLRGITQRLDHLAWLGVAGLWLSPITVSPDDDFGYDVSNYCDVQPQFGTLADADALIAAAHERGIRVLLDLVPNHTSDRHPWFVDARSGKDAPHRDWYVWADPKPDGSPPNNWVSSFGGPAWTFDDASGQYYLHNFLPSQPDLNWWNDEVRDEFDRILRFWFDRGVDGFRIDVCHMIVKDQELRDNPPSTDDDHWFVRLRGQRSVYNAARPEVHDVLRRWRRIADAYDEPRVLLGETYVLDPKVLAEFYGDRDELSMGFNFTFVHAKFVAEELRDIVDVTEGAVGDRGWLVWTGSNHDVSRFPTRWCGTDPDKVRVALLMLLALRGTPVLYYGDEIGMGDGVISAHDLQDPVGKRFFPAYHGRDPERTPMHWTGDVGAGFSVKPDAIPWLPLGNASECNVAEQRDEPGSVLNFCRDLIAVRSEMAELRLGSYVAMQSPPNVWAWWRGERVLVALNLGDEPATLDGPSGEIRLATLRHRDGERVDGALALAPWEGALVWLDPDEGTTTEPR
jgi:alpha-glucosidase